MRPRRGELPFPESAERLLVAIWRGRANICRQGTTRNEERRGVSIWRLPPRAQEMIGIGKERFEHRVRRFQEPELARRSNVKSCGPIMPRVRGDAAVQRFRARESRITQYGRISLNVATFNHANRIRLGENHQEPPSRSEQRFALSFGRRGPNSGRSMIMCTRARPCSALRTSATDQNPPYRLRWMPSQLPRS